MSRNRARWRCSTVLASVLALGIGTAVALLPASSASAATGPGVMTRSVTMLSTGYVSKITYPNGSVVTAFSCKAPMHATTNAPAMTAQSMTAADGSTGTLNSMTVGVAQDATPNMSKARDNGTCDVTDQQIFTSLGDSPTEAAGFAAQFADTSGSATMTSASTGGRTTYATSTGDDLGPPWNIACIDWYYDGSHGHVRGCDRQWKVWTSGADWYVLDRHEESATIDDSGCSLSCDHLTGLRFDEIIPGGDNNIYTVKPLYWNDEGDCVTTNTSVTVKGVTAGNTATSCPEHWGQIFWGQYKFSTKWDGNGSGPSTGSRATHGATGIHSPPSAAAPYASPTGTVWWTSCC